ncbi:MAG TPA: outer membrane lipoprotein chaperone LolA, partial [Candidatus Berkiella sp.]|nr:outer membrane lipoprotein chaperone LolA [Candidatus Berkiella sp.]
MRSILKNALLTLGLCCAVTQAIAEDVAAEQLMASLKKISTFKANFSQKIQGSQGESLSKTQGEVVISRPGKFYWKSKKPDPILVIADGKFVWTYDLDLEQVTKQDLGQALQNSPATLLAGDASKLGDTFNISFAKKCDNNQTCYQLKPKQKDSTFSTINIRFTQDKLNEIRMRDPLGQNVYTVFTHVEVNQSVNQKLF